MRHLLPRLNLAPQRRSRLVGPLNWRLLPPLTRQRVRARVRLELWLTLLGVGGERLAQAGLDSSLLRSRVRG